MRGAYTWSNTSVKERMGLSAGVLYAGAYIGGEIRYSRNRHSRKVRGSSLFRKLRKSAIS